MDGSFVRRTLKGFVYEDRPRTELGFKIKRKHLSSLLRKIIKR